ncbi:ACT domain-containing protein [Nocardioides zeae]
MSAPADPSQPRPTDAGPAHPSPAAAFPAGAPGVEQTLLLTLTGKDRPGVTTSLLGVLAQAGVDVLDVEQIVLRGRLVLGLLVTAPADVEGLRDHVTRAATEVGMQVDVEQGTGDNRSRGPAACTSPSSAPRSGRRRSPRSRGASPRPAPTSTASSGWRATP